MKYLGRPKVCCANCQQWFDGKPFSDGRWGKCKIIGTGYGVLFVDDEKGALPAHEQFWCCHFRLRETAVKLELTKEVELIE